MAKEPITIHSAMASAYNWQVQDSHFYKTYAVEDTADESMGAVLLIPLDANHKNTGSFHITLFNMEDDTVSIPAEDILTPLPAVLQGTVLHFPVSSAKALIPEDNTACPWGDVLDSIRDGLMKTCQS